MAGDGFAYPVLEGRVVGGSGSTAAERVAAILAEAEGEAARIRQAAFARGQAEGYAAGVGDAADGVQLAVGALEQALRGLADTVDRRVADVERQAVELALLIAEKVVASALEIRPELVVDLVAGTLRGLTERDHVVVEVNPEDLELVRAARDGLAERLGGFTRVEVVPERRVQRGGCVVQTTEGEVDGRTEVQLNRVAEIVRAALGGNGD